MGSLHAPTPLPQFLGIRRRAVRPVVKDQFPRLVAVEVSVTHTGHKVWPLTKSRP